MFIGIRFNKGNFKSNSNPNIAQLVLTRRKTDIPALGQSSYKQLILKSTLPIPKQSNLKPTLTLKSTPPISTGVLLVVQPAIIKTAYS